MTLKKILILSTDPSSGKGGIATSVANCAAILEKNSIPFEIIITHTPNTGRIQNSLIFLKAAFRVIFSAPQANVYFLHVGPKGSLIRKTILAIIIKLKGGKAYTQYHSPAFLDYLERDGCWKLILLTLAKLSSKSLALNNYWKNIYETSLNQKFVILPNPLPTSSAYNTIERTPKANGSLNVICAARLIEEKNIQELIRLAELNKEILLKIIGGGCYEDTLRQIAKESEASDRITFMGWLSNQEVKTELSKADIFILPSKYDSFGMVYIEALSEGVPVIAPSIPAVVDTLRDLKGVAFANSAIDINEAINQVINTPTHEIKNSLKEKYGETSYIIKLREIITLSGTDPI